MRVWLTIIVLLGFGIAEAQYLIQPIQREFNLNLERKLNQAGLAPQTIHTFSQPFIGQPLMDSLDQFDVGRWERKKREKWLGRKLKNENLIVIDTGNFYLTIDPVFDFQVGSDLADTANTQLSTNTRGVVIQGAIGSKFSFTSSFYENQSFFPTYLNQYIGKNDIVPGQGRVKQFQTTGYDYAYASGIMAFRPSQNLSIQVGHGKNFYGSGYRSLLLSDNSFNYPYLKLTGSFFKNKLQYQTTHAALISLTRLPATTASEPQFIRKAGTFHSLGYSPIPQIEFAVFEGVMYQNWDSLGTIPLPSTYFSPIIFLNTAAKGLESSRTKSVLGLNLKVNPFRNIKVYGQVAMDSYAGTTNTGYQAGVQVFDVFGLKDLHIQGEYNEIPRNMYKHQNTDLSYVHYNGYMAHPSGGDLSEMLVILDYTWHDVFIHFKYNVIRQWDFKTVESSNGVVQQLRMENVVSYPDVSFGYLINPKTNMKLELGYRGRDYSNAIQSSKTQWVYMAWRMNLKNIYYDF